jgi:carboxymethylenebutenolidase
VNDLQQYLIGEFIEDYQEGYLTRREALRRITAITGSLALANVILTACGVPEPAATTGASPPAAAPTEATIPSAAATTGGSPPPATAGPAAGVRVSADDPAIEAATVDIPGQGTTLIGYLARPTGTGPFPVVLVCHENRGLTDHIQDVTRRLAKAGYVGLAVDLLSRQGGTDQIADPAQVPGILGNTSPEQFVQNFQSGLRYLQDQPDVRPERAGMVGFCFGGGVTWRCATKIAALRAAVPFYGPNPPLEDVPNIQAAVLAIYGAQDQRINQEIPAIEAAMQQHNKTFETVIYPNAGHAFHNDTGRNYNPEAARDAWSKTLAWFEQYLKA